MRKKIALFYMLITSLCFAVSLLALSHNFGVRVNRSGSLPGILYRVVPLMENETVNAGDRVLLDISKISNPVIDRGIERGYVTTMANQPMLKRIAGVPGDRVTLSDNRLRINDSVTDITVASEDSRGGRLFAYPTPIILPPDCYWLVSDPERGFDSRYFGPVRREAITYRAYPLL